MAWLSTDFAEEYYTDDDVILVRISIEFEPMRKSWKTFVTCLDAGMDRVYLPDVPLAEWADPIGLREKVVAKVLERIKETETFLKISIDKGW